MRQFKNFVVVAMALAIINFGSVAHAATQTATMTISAEIVALVTSVTATGMSFGTLIGSSAGNATLDSSAGFTSTLALGAGIAETAASTPQSGICTVTCAAAGTVTLSVTNSTTIGTGTPGQIMTVADMDGNSQTGSQAVVSGTNDFYFGGILQLGASQAAGTYTGDTTVTVTF